MHRIFASYTSARCCLKQQLKRLLMQQQSYDSSFREKRRPTQPDMPDIILVFSTIEVMKVATNNLDQSTVFLRNLQVLVLLGKSYSRHEREPVFETFFPLLSVHQLKFSMQHQKRFFVPSFKVAASEVLNSKSSGRCHTKQRQFSCDF